MVRKKKNSEIVVMYANIQGFRGKKTSLLEVMETMNVDIVLLAETMTRNVSIEGCLCITRNLQLGKMCQLF